MLWKWFCERVRITVSEQKQCKALKLNKQQCSRHAQKDSKYCWQHRFSRFRDTQWYNNTTLQFLATIVVTVVCFAFSPTRSNQDLVVSPDVIELGKGDWKAKCQFSIHNPTDKFFYGLWLKLSINSESLSYVDFDVIPPNNLPSTWFQAEHARVNSSLVRLDGVDSSGKESIYLLLEILAPKMTYTFELVNISANDLPSSAHSANLSILKYSSKPLSKMQGDVSGFMKIGSPPENFSTYRAFQLTEEGNLQLVEIRNEPGVIPKWSERHPPLRGATSQD